MVRILPVLRCPVCGKLSYFPNFVGFHRVEALVQKIKGLGRGKGFSNIYEPSPVKGDLIAWWIRRLQEVINWLEMKRNPTLSMRPKEKPILSQTSTGASLNVWGESVSPKETKGKSLYPSTSPSLLSVRSSSPSISFRTNKCVLTSRKDK